MTTYNGLPEQDNKKKQNLHRLNQTFSDWEQNADGNSQTLNAARLIITMIHIPLLLLLGNRFVTFVKRYYISSCRRDNKWLNEWVMNSKTSWNYHSLVISLGFHASPLVFMCLSVLCTHSFAYLLQSSLLRDGLVAARAALRWAEDSSRSGWLEPGRSRTRSHCTHTACISIQRELLFQRVLTHRLLLPCLSCSCS